MVPLVSLFVGHNGSGRSAAAVQMLLALFLSASAVESRVYISEFMASNGSIVFDNDFYEYSDWIELSSNSNDSVDLGGYQVIDDSSKAERWEIPEGTILPPGSVVVIWADDRDTTGRSFHTGFKLDADGEVLFLYSPDSGIVDSVTYSQQATDVSLGRVHPDSMWEYYGIPTPGSVNDTNGIPVLRYAPEVTFSERGGVHLNTFSLVLSTQDEFPGTIRYSTDCSVPDEYSAVYEEPLAIEMNRVIRARVFADGYIPGKVTTSTYIFRYDSDLAIACLVTDSANLWDDSSGIYCKGVNGIHINESWGKEPGNFNQPWERPANLEVYDTTGRQCINQSAGIRIQGEIIRLFDQKPFSVYARGNYSGNFNYRFFKEKEIFSFNNIILRPGGNDWAGTMMVEGVINNIIRERMDIDIQAYRPGVLFLNGEYWGIYNFREKVNEDYLYDNYHIEPSKVDMLENFNRVIAGENSGWNTFIDSIASVDMRDDEKFRYIEDRIDLQEFINYYITEIFFGNRDWPAVNVRFWRKKEEDARWRWILCGIDLPLKSENVDYNMLEYVTSTIPDSSGSNTLASTLLFRKCLENAWFAYRFIQLFAHHLSTTFDPDRTTGIIDSMKASLIDEIPKQIERWGMSDGNGFNTFKSMAAWEWLVDELAAFSEARTEIQTEQICEKFLLPGYAALTIDLPSSEMGNIFVYDQYMTDTTATENYFQKIPVRFTAVPKAGYRFTGWSDKLTGSSVVIVPGRDSTLTPRFASTEGTVLQDGISSNDTLRISRSPYLVKKNVTIDSGVILWCEPGVELRFSGTGGFVVHGGLRFKGTTECPVLLSANTVAGAENWRNILFKNASDSSLLLHMELRGATRGADPESEKGAITVINSHVEIRNCSITDVPFPVFVRNGSVLIDSCFLASTETGDLVNVVNSAFPVVLNSRLAGNGFDDADAIDYDNVRQGRIVGNRIYHFHGPNSDGIDLGEGSEEVVIQDNFIVSCTDKGISVGQGSTAHIRGNVIADCSQGIGIKDSGSFAEIRDNNFCYNDTAIACFEKNIGKGGGSALVNGCIFYESKNMTLAVGASSEITVANSLCSGEKLPGENNIEGDPLFRNIDGNDFTFLEQSPCRKEDVGDQDGKNDVAIGRSVDYSVGGHDGAVISEILFEPADGAEYEFFELFNPMDSVLEMGGCWVNRAVTCAFPQKLQLLPKVCLVVAAEKEVYTEKTAGAVLEWTDGKLANEGECLQVYDRYGDLVDYVYYLPSEIDSDLLEGASIQLAFPDLDNSKMESWKAGRIDGTPGEVNFDIKVEVLHRTAPHFNLRVGISHLTVAFPMHEPGIAEVLVTDLKGRMVATLLKKNLKKGDYSFTITLPETGGGVYLLILKRSSRKLVKKLLIQR